MSPSYNRIYHHHVRKTAGSSLNAAFWTLGGLEAAKTDADPTQQVVESNGMKFVAYNSALIEAGDYFFSTSHIPAWRLDLPSDTFTITILRDPAARVMSYYRYLLWARALHADGNFQTHNDSDPQPFRGFTHWSLEAEVDALAGESDFIDGGLRYSLNQLSLHSLRFEWSAIKAFGVRQYLSRLSPRRREASFREFLTHVPPHFLWTQLHMFSQRFDPAEAADNALSCSAVCFTETFSQDLKDLANTLELDLRPKHERRFGNGIEITEAEREILRERLAPEYEMIARVRTGVQQRPASHEQPADAALGFDPGN